MVEIREIRSRSDIKKFIRFPVELYRDNPYYTPPMESDELTNLLPGKNAAYAFCETKFFLAYREGKIVGRVCALHSKLANERWGTSRLRFTRLDFIDDYEVSAALLGAVEGWARELGLRELQGPLGFVDVDYEGLLTEGFDQQNLFITIYSAPYYLDHLKKLGFVKDAEWVERKIRVPDQLDPAYDKVQDFILKKKNLHILQMKKIKEVLPYAEKIFGLLNICYHKLYGVVPLSDELIRQYKDRFFGYMDPDFVSIILDEQDNVVAFGLSMPSLALASKAGSGRLFPTAWVKFLHDLKVNDTLELLLIGVHPDYQKLGLNGIMINEIWKRARKRGIIWAETGPTLINNFEIQAQWDRFGQIHKRRCCFVKALDPETMTKEE